MINMFLIICESLRLARILAARGGSGSAGGTEGVDAREAAAFRRSTLSAYLQGTF